MSNIAVLAFSGGLDTSYCAIWLREQGFQVHTVAVDTGGFEGPERDKLMYRAKELEVAEHQVIDARKELFDDYLRYLIFANATRGGVYPYCVAAERVVQAKKVAEYANQVGAAAVSHGSTGAGNDQIRFDTAFRIFAPDAQLVTPIREQALSRQDEMSYLIDRGISVQEKTGRYSFNRGLWGTTIGGAETHTSTDSVPDDAFPTTVSAANWPNNARDIRVTFEAGIPTQIDGEAMEPVRLIEMLNELGAAHGVGRGIHVGDTILGIKGRVAFEAPAAAILLPAHRELEKLVLTSSQMIWKGTLGEVYGSFLHEARFFDPLTRDIEAFLTSSQRRVRGDVNVRLFAGQASVLGVTSPHSLMGVQGARYGEESSLWTGPEAAGFGKLYGLQQVLHVRAGKQEG